MLNKDGIEILDTTPVEVPVGFKRPLTLAEQMKMFVRDFISNKAQEEGQETFEDADDFECDDDSPDYSSPWELDFDQEQNFQADKRRFQEERPRDRNSGKNSIGNKKDSGVPEESVRLKNTPAPEAKT